MNNYEEMALAFYQERLTYAEDIREHLPVLLEYASQSNRIVELGVRSIVSTWAFILGKPKKLISVDIVSPDYYTGKENSLDILEKICKNLNIDFRFILADDLTIELDEMDLLFIDTLHTYSQLDKELRLHANKSKKWIILHDTQSFGEYVMNSIGIMEGGMKYALDKFLLENNSWFIKKHYSNCHGLTILERK